jgi:predicted nucleic acid-binding protein
MGSMFLVDTNVISLIARNNLGLLKTQEEIDVAKWYESKAFGTPFILSFATSAELNLWLLSIKEQKTKEKTASAIKYIIESSYLLQSNDEVIESWAIIAHEARTRGKMSTPKPQSSQINDVWIAATAHANKLKLLTYDTDFDWMADLGVEVVKYKKKTSSSTKRLN